MRQIKLGLILAGIASILMSGCGGGGGSASSSSSSSGGANTPPVANAGTAQTVNSGATVTLNGTGSNDPGGSISTYAWTQTAGTAVTLSNASVAQPTFTAPPVATATTLTFSLVVTDNRGAASSASTVNITVNPANASPTANAGPAQTITSGVQVTLNGSGSSDSDGTIASFAWTQTAGAAVTLSNAATATPSFTAPAVTTTTTLTFSLVVTDNRGASSAASTVNIIVNPGNFAPTANPGATQSVPAGQLVSLTAVASVDPDGTIVSFAWTQTSGPSVALSSNSGAAVTFTAPSVTTSLVLTFSLVVTDDDGASSAPASVRVTVNPVGTPTVTISGRIRHARAPFNTSSPFGLNYAGAFFEPTRGVVVRALYADTSDVISTAFTDANGDYSLQVPGSTAIQVRAVAWLIRDSGQPLPRYDVRVQNAAGIGVTDPYSYTDAELNSASGVTRNVDIPLNINASGQATGVRASGPFAVLDTVYEGMQLVLGVAPQTNFPALIVDWGAQSDGTFFSSGNPQRIALLSDLTEDTDEFDAHVVAHEFGHYIEFNFSRADNIGGSHGLGDRLDARVAFGEGFGYAFAAMVLGDPNARDSFVDGTTRRSSGFNIEDNPPAPLDPTGCWCSESSVWSILYDIFDSSSDGDDALSLGFAPIWNVLISAQRTTPAFTTIFSFITALKAAQPAEAAAINTLVAAQSIDTAGMDAFATGESHFPSNVPQVAALPLYTTVTIGGGPVVLRNVNDAGRHNKLGNRRYVRFNVPSTRNVTISVATSNTSDNDPDFTLRRGATFIDSGDDPPPGPETHTYNLTAGDYVLDVYDCSNGCSTEQGTSGDYNITVTIN